VPRYRVFPAHQRGMQKVDKMSYLFYQESTNLAFLSVLDLPCPDDKEPSDWRIGDPSLGAVECVSLLGLDGGSFHR
jgi:hypothetical protein